MSKQKVITGGNASVANARQMVEMESYGRIYLEELLRYISLAARTQA